MADIFNIAGEINSTSYEGTAVHANQVKDDLLDKKQEVINQEVGEELTLHTNRLNALTGQNYITVQATQSTTTADIPTLINASGEGEQADTLYRVGFWDGSAYVADKYTEYAWNGTAYVILDVKSSIGEVFDISQYNAVGGTLTPYEDLEAALGVDGANVPSSVRRGGMSVKFVQSNDNKYVQYRLMSDTFNTTPSNWQGVDDKPLIGSNNLLESNGAAEIDFGLTGTVNYKRTFESYRITPSRCRLEIPLKSGITYPVILNNESEIDNAALYYIYSDNTTGSMIKTITKGFQTTITPTQNLKGIALYKENTTSAIVSVSISNPESVKNYLESVKNYLESSDNVPTAGSAKLVKSDGIRKYVENETTLERKYLANILYGVFVNGGLTQGVLQPNLTFRVATDTIMSYPYDIMLHIANGYRIGVHFFVNGAFSEDSGWQTSDYLIPKNSQFKVVISAINEDQSTPADIDSFVSNVTLRCCIDDVLNGKIGNYILPQNQLSIVVGSLDGANGGINSSSDCLCYSKYIDVIGGSYLYLHYADDIKIRIAEYDNSKTLISTTGTYSQIDYVLLNSSTKYVRISASYSLRGYNSSNRISVEDYINKDFGVYVNLNQSIENQSDSISILGEHDKYSLSGFFIGKDSTFSDDYIYGLRPGRVYRVVLKADWENVSGVIGNKFAISNWFNNTSTLLKSVAIGNTVADYYDITIPENSDYIAIGGRANQGIRVPWYIFDITEYSNHIASKMEIEHQKVTANCATQGLTIVDGTIIHFFSSVDDHSSYADVLLWDSQYQSLTKMTHNLGHAATVDYNKESDSIVVGNGTSDITVAPRLDIVTNARSKIVAGGTLNYSDPDIIHIELATANKEIGGSGLICTFGGNWRIVYLATGQNAPRKIFKCLLGVGNEDFSDTSIDGSDVTKWGTFISGKLDNEYNGTLKVLATYTGAETGVYQGMCYKNGFIYLACGYTSADIHKIRLYNDSKYEIIQTNKPIDFNADGSEKNVEPEGLCFVDNETMLVGLPSYGGLFTIEKF